MGQQYPPSAQSQRGQNYRGRPFHPDLLFASSVVYLIFVSAQFTYLFAGIGSLPKDTTLAEYSRRGFFELVFVIVITTVIMAAVCMLTKNNQHDRLPVYVKIPLLIITASNAVMIVSAARRLIIYISEYNMTVSRFNAAVLIGLMAVVVVVVALRIIFDRISVSAVVGSILALTAAAYCICNVDGLVAKYNVDRYLANPDAIDVAYLSENLSVAAIPQLERLMNDPLEARGLGFSYSRKVPTADGLSVRLRSFGTKEDAFDHYVDFHAEVAKRLFRSGNNTLLIDCHSFSQHPNLLNPTPPDIDICIGFNDDETCPDETTIGIISQYFKSLGYKVGINEPFSNSMTFNVPICYHSLMIEVNKRLYMNEHTLEKTPVFYKLRQEIQGLFDLLISTSRI